MSQQTEHTPELEPCPFCGSKADEYWVDGSSPYGYLEIHCSAEDDCPVSPMIDEKINDYSLPCEQATDLARARLYARWNKRAGLNPAVVRECLEAARQLFTMTDDYCDAGPLDEPYKSEKLEAVRDAFQAALAKLEDKP